MKRMQLHHGEGQNSVLFLDSYFMYLTSNQVIVLFINNIGESLSTCFADTHSYFCYLLAHKLVHHWGICYFLKLLTKLLTWKIMDFGCNFIIVLLLEMTVVVEVPERKSQALKVPVLSLVEQILWNFLHFGEWSELLIPCRLPDILSMAWRSHLDLHLPGSYGLGWL